jgi:hypothetical protein
MPDFSTRQFILWLIITLLSLSLCGVLWEGYQRQQTKQATIDSLRTVQEQTVDDRRRYKRLANSNTEGLSNAEEREVLWATRTIISETKNASEMIFIGNVIRNRVDLNYQGRKTVRQVILDPYQFSAFNPNRNSRWKYINMTEKHVSDSLWAKAWKAARFTMTAPREVLPLSNPCINHFAHHKRVVDKPDWMFQMEQISLGDIESPRLSIYKQNDESPCQTRLASR